MIRWDSTQQNFLSDKLTSFHLYLNLLLQKCMLSGFFSLFADFMALFSRGGSMLLSFDVHHECTISNTLSVLHRMHHDIVHYRPWLSLFLVMCSLHGASDWIALCYPDYARCHLWRITAENKVNTEDNHCKQANY